MDCKVKNKCRRAWRWLSEGESERKKKIPHAGNLKAQFFCLLPNTFRVKLIQ